MNGGINPQCKTLGACSSEGGYICDSNCEKVADTSCISCPSIYVTLTRQLVFKLFSISHMLGKNNSLRNEMECGANSTIISYFFQHAQKSKVFLAHRKILFSQCPENSTRAVNCERVLGERHTHCIHVQFTAHSHLTGKQTLDDSPERSDFHDSTKIPQSSSSFSLDGSSSLPSVLKGTFASYSFWFFLS